MIYRYSKDRRWPREMVFSTRGRTRSRCSCVEVSSLLDAPPLLLLVATMPENQQ